MSPSLFTVIGGANMDIIAVPERRILPGDSAPGRIRFIPGGVGRNIAQALKITAGTGSRVELITALGDDASSSQVREITEKTGVSFAHSLIFPGRTCPTYAAIMDGGDLLSAVNDMGLLKEITPERLDSCREILNEADMIILDANLEEETIRWVAEIFPSKPLFAETVSAVKCIRFLPVLSRLYGIKPNKLEAEKLTGMTINNTGDALESAALLHREGVDNVIITLGSAGSVYYSSKEWGIIYASPLENVQDINGAGDYYLAGVLPALREGLSLEEAARSGSMNALRKLKGEV